MSGPSVRDRSLSRQLFRMGYGRARNVLVVIGLALMGVVVAVLLVRSVDQTEVLATVLYVPLFVVVLFFGVIGGAVGAVIATAIYVVVRLDAIDALGWGEFSGLVVSRAAAYGLFGLVGGWAASTLEDALDKLDLHDHIDDRTGLHNARFLLDDVDVEKARAERYRSVFSVSFVDIPAEAFAAVPTRRRRTLYRDLGRFLRGSVRTIDRVTYGADPSTHHLAAVLPETPASGAAIFHERLLGNLRRFLVDNGVPEDVSLSGTTVTVPGDEDALAARLERWERIDAAEHASPRG